MDLDVPTTVNGVDHLADIIDHVNSSPGIPSSWLNSDRITELLQKAHSFRTKQANLATDEEDLVEKAGETILELPISLLNTLQNTLRKCRKLIGLDLLTHVSDHVKFNHLIQFGQELDSVLGSAKNNLEIVLNKLGISKDYSINSCRDIVPICDIALSDARPDSRWFEPELLVRLDRVMADGKVNCDNINEYRNQLLEIYDERYFSLAGAKILDDLTLKYTSPLRWFSSEYRSIRKRLKAYNRKGVLDTEYIESTRTLASLQKLESIWEASETEICECMGQWFCGLKTRWEAAEKAMKATSRLIEICPKPILESTIKYLSIPNIPDKEFCEATRQLNEFIRLWDSSLRDELFKIISEFMDISSDEFERLDLGYILKILGKLQGAFVIVNNVIHQIELHHKTCLGLSPSEAADLLRKLSNLKNNNITLLSEYEQIGDAYGNTLSSIPTDWELIIPKLDWTKHLLLQLHDRHVGDALAQHATLPGQTLDPPIEIISRSKELKSYLGDLSTLFTEHQDSWPVLTDGSADLIDILALIEKLRDRIAEVPDLVQLRRIYKDSALVNLVPFIEACLKKNVSGSNLTSAFKASILRLWIDWIISLDTTLSRHHRDPHDHQVNNFKKVDRRLWKNGPSRVIVRAKSHLPGNYSPVPGGETSVIFRERQKKRRLLPIRKLFAKIPRLLPDLKPCLLMSPLSVSQFLTPGVGQFDLLIFDEASQIRAEDAIGCIYRCKQITVCGDEKQLPPTLFFEQGIMDDLDVDESDEYYDEFESIIKQCLAVGIKSRWLRWHYRSRHESLIVFSNKQFYWERPLVTFPASKETAPELGVELIFVPDGVYDRGHTRTNECEARKVVLKVEELVRLYPAKSLGIVTFSVAQKEMVEDLLEESMKTNATLAELARNDRLPSVPI